MSNNDQILLQAKSKLTKYNVNIIAAYFDNCEDDDDEVIFTDSP